MPKNVFSAFKVSRAWTDFVIVLKLLGEYTKDYFAGQKYRKIANTQRDNQKQK